MEDSFGLERFVLAQDAGGTYQLALEELRSGDKQSHWMWFIFPQVAGLGQSPTSRKYAIASLAEAEAYLLHPVLGLRLVECAKAVAAHTGLSAVRRNHTTASDPRRIPRWILATPSTNL